MADEITPLRPEYTFGTQLWSQLDQVDTYMATGVEYHLALNEFFKGYAQAELDFAAQLLKIAKPFRDAIAKSKEKWQKANDPALSKQVTVNYSSSVMTAWERLLMQTEDIAAFHFEISEVMNKERKDVKGTANQLQIHTKQNFEKIKISQSELTKLIETMDKNQHSYERELKMLETSGNHLKKCFKEKRDKEIDKSRMEFEKQIAAAKHSLFFYKTSVETVNSAKQKHYSSTIPDVLTEIQKEDESTRIELTRNTMIKIADSITTTLPKETLLWSTFGDFARKIDPSFDSHLLIAAFKTVDKPPVDFSYLDTRDALKKKLSLLTENNFKAEDDEDLGNPRVQPKQGKKKAAERVKLIEKEIVDLEKKRQGLGAIVSTLTELPHSESGIQEVLLHKTDIELKLNSLTARRQFFLEYIADADGKPRPPPPTLLTIDTQPYITKSSASTASLKSPTDAIKSPIKSGSPAEPLRHDVTTPSNVLHVSSSQKEQTEPDGDLFGGGYVTELIRDTDKKISEDQIVLVGSATAGSPTDSSGLESVLESVLFKGLEKVEMLYDFDAAELSAEISVRAGTQMEIMELEAGEGWARCRLIENPSIEGLVPRAYIGK